MRAFGRPHTLGGSILSLMAEVVNTPLLLAPDRPTCARLALALGASVERLPEGRDLAEVERWRALAAVSDRASAGASQVVVSLGLEPLPARALGTLDEAAWDERFEHPWVLYNVAIGSAVRRVADGGAIVVVVQAAAVPDAAGFAPERALADGVVALVRSIAERESARGVRANVVTSPIGLDDAPRREAEVAGAIRLFLSEEAAGLSGRVAPVDGGRTL